MLSLHPNVNRWEKDPETHQYNSGNPQRESLDRNMLTLVRRSLRKADYLRRLKQYYAYESSTNPLDMIAYLRSPKEDGNGLVGLSPGVRMEALDPFHRPVELHIKNGVFHDGADLLDDMVGITAAFSAWLRGATAHSAPFFMWLEDHPICLRDDKAEVAGTRAVYYGAADSFEASPMGRVQLVNVGGVCMSVDLPTYRGQHICDTSDYQAAERKGGTGTAAYIWTADRELFIGQHREGAFHHSSFISGRQVRCAGMIKFAAGKVARARGIADTGWRVVANNGRDAHQLVLHLHVHVLGGRKLGWPPG